LLALLCFVSVCSAADYGFDRLDPQWQNFNASGLTFEKLKAIMKKYEMVPEVRHLMGLVDEMKEKWNSIDWSEEVVLDPDTFRTIPEIIRDKGYPAEQHNIVTPDGYILECFRIPYGRSTPKGGPPVILSHGLMDSAGSWVLNYPGESLSYILANAGYDVWMNNIRGNKYGDTHNILDPETDDEFWDLSFDEQGKIDIPAIVDYVRNMTGYEKVSIIGHSQGGTQFFAGLYWTPSLAEKVNLFVGLAPAYYFKWNINVIIHIGAHLFMGEILEALGVDEFFPFPETLHRSLARFCETFPRVVEAFLGAIMGYNPGETNYARYGVLCYQSLGFTSMQNMVHWAQMVRTSEYKAHDYGTNGNQDRYGSRNPPLYVLDQVVPSNLPVAIFYGSLDTLVSPWDTEDVIADLPVPPVFVKHIYRYSHCDFTWALSAKDEIYPDILNLLKQYAGSKN